MPVTAEKAPLESDTDTKGLRTLSVDLAEHGRIYPFAGEGSSDGDVAVLYLLGRGRRNALGFLLFVASLALPLWAFRDRRALAVALLSGALVALSLIPELVPALSGACNLGVAGLLLGLALSAVAPAVGFARGVFTRWVLPAAVVALMVAAGPAALAGEKKPKKPEKDDPKVYIPYDPEKIGKDGIPIEKVFLPYRQFLQLWDAAFPGNQVYPKALPAPFAHIKSHYIGEIDGEWFRGGAVFVVEAFGDKPVEIPLGLKGAMVEQAMVNKKPAALRQTADGYAFAAPQAGRFTLDVTFRAKTKGEGKTGRISLGLFPVAWSSAIIRLTDPVLTCEVPSALGGLVRDSGPDAEVVTAHLGPADSLVIEYRPKEPEKGGEFATLKAQTDTRFIVEPDVQKIRFGCRFEVVGAPRDSFRFALDRDVHVLKIEGPRIRAWGFKQHEGARTLEVHLTEPEEKGAAYVIEAVRAVKADSGKADLPELRPMDCMQEKGLLAIECPDHRRFTVEERDNLQHEDAAGLKPLAHPVTAAFRFSRRPIKLVYKLEDKPARLDGSMVLAALVAPEDLRLAAIASIQSNGAPVYGLEAVLPDGYRVDRVEVRGAAGLKDWWVSGEGAGRTLHVSLDRGLTGRAGLWIWMSDKLSVREGKREFPVPSIKFPAFESISGRVVILAFQGIHLEAGKDLQNLEPADAGGVWGEFCSSLGRRTVPVLGGAIGFKFGGKEYKGSFSAETRKPALSCKWVIHQRLKAEAVEYGLYLTYKAERAPAKQLAFSLPSWVPKDQVTIFCPAKREEEKIAAGDRTIYRIGLQTGFMGEWRVAAHFRLPLEAKDASFVATVPAARPEEIGDGESKGWLVVENAEESSQIAEKEITGLERVDPDKAASEGGLPPGLELKDVTFAYRLMKGFHAAMEIKTIVVDKGQDVEVDYVDMLTALKAGGESWNRAVLRVRNRSRQFLAVDMPAKARILSLTVAGVPARPGRTAEDGKILVPMPRGSVVDPAFDVEIVYTLHFGSMQLLTPTILKHPVVSDSGVRVGKVFWTVRVPSDFSYRFSGDMQETRRARIEETRIGLMTQETGQMLDALDKMPEKLRKKGLLNIGSNLAESQRQVDLASRQKQVAGKAEQSLRAKQAEQVAILRQKVEVIEQEESRKRQEENALFENAARFTRHQEGVANDAWEMLEPDAGGRAFGAEDQLRGEQTQRTGPAGDFTPLPTVPPPSVRTAKSLGAGAPEEKTREFSFVKEGGKAELGVIPWEGGVFAPLGTLLKIAGVALIFIAALILGWLREEEGWPWKRAWLWMVLLVCAGAALSSWVMALALGGIAGWLAFKEYSRQKTEKDRKKPGYVV